MIRFFILDIPEPVYSTLQGVGEILTNFVCNNLWDRLFRLTLISATAQTGTVEQFMEQYKPATDNVRFFFYSKLTRYHLMGYLMAFNCFFFQQFGTPTGTVWTAIFTNLVNLSNNYFQNADTRNSSLVPVAEQIPILHRIGKVPPQDNCISLTMTITITFTLIIDHSVHSMRLWVKEESKQLCNEWKMNRFFQILEYDVKQSLSVFNNFKLPKLTADLSDILMLVCVALRTKLICEINANIDKLKVCVPPHSKSLFLFSYRIKTFAENN